MCFLNIVWWSLNPFHAPLGFTKTAIPAHQAAAAPKVKNAVLMRRPKKPEVTRQTAINNSISHPAPQQRFRDHSPDTSRDSRDFSYIEDETEESEESEDDDTEETEDELSRTLTL